MSNIILFGDSLFGQFGRRPIRAFEETKPDSLVFNCAAGGLNTRDCLKRAPLIAKMQGEYVFISLGANDCYDGREMFVPLDEFRSNMLAIINMFSGSEVILFPCPPLDDPGEPEETKKYNETLDIYNKILIEIASQKNISTIDSKSVYGKLLTSGQDYHKEDGIHLNELGYEVLVREMTKFIR